MTTLQPKPVLVGSRSHGEPFNAETFTIPRSGDPPSVAAATAGPGAHWEEAAHGGVAAEPLPPLLDHESSIWDLLTQPDGHGAPQDLSDLLMALAASPELRSAALLRGMERFRDVLDQLPGHTPLDQPITIAACDLLVLTRALLGRLR
jgi:hypothetical protein